MASSTQQKQHLALAVQAAARRDAAEYLRQFAASFVADGVISHLSRRWPSVDVAVLHDAVSDAANILYEQIARSRAVRQPAGFIMCTAEKIMLKWWRDRPDHVPLSGDELDPGTGLDEESMPELDREALRTEALRIARSFLPKLGLDVVPRVMGFILDCVEAGDTYVDNATIAEALGVTVATVRRSKDRGFDRLTALARAAGLKLDDRFKAAAEDAKREREEEEEAED